MENGKFPHSRIYMYMNHPPLHGDFLPKGNRLPALAKALRMRSPRAALSAR